MREEREAEAAKRRKWRKEVYLLELENRTARTSRRFRARRRLTGCDS
jgi:hypothetical protein